MDQLSSRAINLLKNTFSVAEGHFREGNKETLSEKIREKFTVLLKMLDMWPIIIIMTKYCCL